MAPLTLGAPAGQGWPVVFDLGLAFVLSAAIGLEREIRQKSAGLRTHTNTPRVILMTAFGDAETHAEAARLGALRVFDKPFDVDTVRAFVCGALPRDDRR